MVTIFIKFRNSKVDLKENFINNWKNSNARRFLNSNDLKWYEARLGTKFCTKVSPKTPFFEVLVCFGKMNFPIFSKKYFIFFWNVYPLRKRYTMRCQKATLGGELFTAFENNEINIIFIFLFLVFFNLSFLLFIVKSVKSVQTWINIDKRYDFSSKSWNSHFWLWLPYVEHFEILSLTEKNDRRCFFRSVQSSVQNSTRKWFVSTAMFISFGSKNLRAFEQNRDIENSVLYVY